MCTFNLLYGGFPATLQEIINKDSEVPLSFKEVETIWHKWWDNVNTFRNFKEAEIEKARKAGYTQTYFGRRRPLYGINLKYKEVDPIMNRDRSFWERTALSTKIQGSSADIMKSAMVRIYQRIKKEGWEPYVKLILTIHDELVFEVKKEYTSLIVPVLDELMRIEIKEWPIKLNTDCECGTSWSVSSSYEEYEKWLKYKIEGDFVDFINQPKEVRKKLFQKVQEEQKPVEIKDQPKSDTKPVAESSRYILKLDTPLTKRVALNLKSVFESNPGSDTILIKCTVGDVECRNLNVHKVGKFIEDLNRNLKTQL